MITYKIEGRIKRDDAPGGYKRLVEGMCISTDEKPTDVANGSILIEMDTSKIYMFNEVTGEWLPWTSNTYTITDPNNDGNIVVTSNRGGAMNG